MMESNSVCRSEDLFIFDDFEEERDEEEESNKRIEDDTNAEEYKEEKENREKGKEVNSEEHTKEENSGEHKQDKKDSESKSTCGLKEEDAQPPQSLIHSNLQIHVTDTTDSRRDIQNQGDNLLRPTRSDQASQIRFRHNAATHSPQHNLNLVDNQLELHSTAGTPSTSSLSQETAVPHPQAHERQDVSTTQVHGTNQMRDVLWEGTSSAPTVYNLTGNTGVKVVHQKDSAHTMLSQIHDQTNLLLGRELEPRLLVKTAVIDKCRQHLQSRGMVTITGNSGEGKSTASMYLLQLLSETDSRKPLVLTDPVQWDYIPTQPGVKHPVKFTVLIDNIFGRSNLVQDLQTRWEQKLPMMMPLVEAGIVVLIMTFRTTIYLNCKDSLKQYELFRRCPVCDFPGAYNLIERQAFLDNHANVYARQMVLSKKEKEDILESQQLLGFPQCCFLFATHKELHTKGKQFFTKPLLYLTQCLETMVKRDQLSYLVLLLVMFYDGRLPVKVFNQFERSRNDQDTLKNLAQECISTDRLSVSLLELRNKAHSLCGSYLAWDNNQKIFSFSHQSISDTLFLHFCKSHLSKGISICSVRTLLEYVRTEEGSRDESEWIVVVTKTKYGVLAERLTKEIMSGDASLILTHPAFKDYGFVTYLVSKYWDNEQKKILCSQPFDQLSVGRILHLSINVMRDLVNHHFLLKKHYGILKGQTLNAFKCDSLLVMAMVQGAEKLSISLLPLAKQFLNTKNYFIVRNNLLACSFYDGNDLLIYRLMDEGAEITQECLVSVCLSPEIHTSVFNFTLCIIDQVPTNLLQNMIHFCIECGRLNYFEKMAEVLSKRQNGTKRLQMACIQILLMFHTATPLWFNSWPERKRISMVDSVKLLIELGVDCSSDKCVLLAAGCGDSSVLDTVLVCGGNPRCTTTNKVTPVHMAALHGSVNSLSLMLKHSDVDVVDDNGYTPLHFAVFSSVQSAEKVELLLDLGCNIQCKTVTEVKPVIALSVEAGNFATLSYLLQAAATMDIEAGFLAHDAVRLLINCVDEKRPGLQESFVKHRLRVVELLLQHGYSMTYRDNNNMTPLHLLVAAGHVSLLEYFLDDVNCTDVYIDLLHHSITHHHFAVFDLLYKRCTNTIDETGNTPLHTVLSETAELYRKGDENQNILEYLLDQDLDVNAVNHVGDTALHLASISNNVIVAKTLLHKGANTTVCNMAKNSPLHTASRYGSYDVLKVLVDSGVDVTLRGESGDTVLHAAVRGGHIKLVRYIVGIGLDIDVLNKDDESPILVAAKHSHLHIVNFLIVQGASVHFSIKNVISIVKAIQFGHRETFEKLLQINCPKTIKLLFTAIKFNRFDMVQLLCRDETNVEVRNRNGETFLHCAAKSGSLEIVEFLIERGASVNSRDKSGKVPLHMATETGQTEIVTFLISSGSELQTVDHSLRCPLHYAVINDHLETVKSLCTGGADLNLSDRNRNTSLHIAAGHGHVDIAKYLVEDGAKLQVKNIAGRTPLHVAAKNGSVDLVEYFAENTTGLNVLNYNAQTPLHLAARYGHLNIIKCLVQRGAAVNTVDINKQVPLHGAAKHIN